MAGRNGEETGTTESWRSRGEEPRKKGPKDSLQNSHLCPRAASPPTLTLSVNVVAFVCLPSNPEEQRTRGEWGVFVSGSPSPSAVVNMCSPPPWAAGTSHGLRTANMLSGSSQAVPMLLLLLDRHHPPNPSTPTTTCHELHLDWE